MRRMRIRSLTIAAFCGYVAASAAALQAGQAAPRSVWDGVYTAEQAARGQMQFSQHCAECHGAALGGGEGPALVGDRFWTTWQESTVRALFDRISKNMPFSDDGSLAGTLPRQTYVDVVAHILSSNGFPSGAAELTPDTGVGVQIVRREGPTDLPAGVLAQVVGCLQRSGNEWHVVKASRPARSGAFTTATAKTAALGDREFNLKFVLTSLDRYAGQKVMASGTLIGQGGADGLNTDTVTPVSPTCE
jgi:S-disulfanyl-L-cysteine oxidoreductase SoxD